ncbi:Chloramphenicol acetyltransferase-like domain protein [Metarhizium album ARSEF 1941]|uniref:Chloramphenicol acetyltransferase-like domain protein n=1 Tax=Metarhizium album (strain ARSEF 1941) TaxID=1081103 RepID=A0A0B2WJV7_METAS|nr:Chloramphenicol acetyltransferase-like domain protein [Metarhizium album ARSEF 1941]KHN93737.1 Chloramphenicol acetyltransferase-like domain protein [Metarhizium album ARSEF 1941]
MSPSNAREDEYTIVPLTLLDATLGNVNLYLRVSMIFDAQLSFEKLRSSWFDMIRARPVIGALVRRSKSSPSALAYHIPTPATLERYIDDQFTVPDQHKDFFCMDESHRSINDYCPAFGTGARAPTRSTDGIFVADGAAPEDKARCTGFNGIASIQELLDSNRPIVTTQVTRFRDATVITCSMSHIFGDLFSFKAMFQGWESALHGASPAPFEQLGVDPFRAYGPGGELGSQGGTEPVPPPGWRVYGWMDKARFLRRFLWDVYVSRPERTISSKHIFIPESHLRALEDRAKHDLVTVQAKRRRRGRAEQETPLRVSRSDVLYAWLLKNNHAHLAPDHWCSPATIANARAKPPAPLRARSSDFPSHEWYGAAMCVGLGSLRAGDIMKMPLGELALYVREAVKENSSRENAKKWMAFQLHHNLWKKPSGRFVFWCPPHHHWSGLTDWRLGKLPDVDFTPARIDGGGDDNRGPVTVCAIDGYMISGSTQRNCWICLGEADGGVWIIGITGQGEWTHPQGLGRYRRLRHRPASKL